MIGHPRIGQSVRLHYAAKTRHARPLHGKTGTVVIAGKGKPRNHGVLIEGQVYIVPCGNLQPIKEAQS